ncbi:MAG: DNA cytosine methyltransferase [Crenarchaeota archaeon]|nr:DNA cytosine methyltransferase [Thermoproteota archaeon]
MVYRVIDLFCGAGGFSRGFRDAGFRIVLGVDNDSSCVRTYSFNFPEAVALEEDVRYISGRDLLKLVGDRPDVVIGGSPCEPFTGVNPRRLSDPLDRLYVDELGQLTLHFIRLVGELQPRIFVLENVPELAKEPLRSAIEYEFSRVGYSKIFFNILRAERYGTPSIRRRVFISNIEIKPRGEGRIVTVEDALRDLPPPGSDNIPNHDLPSLSKRKLYRISKLKYGEALMRFRGHDGVYRNLIKLDPRKPAPTVMGSSRFVHPYESRILTVREQARLQGFPDDHVFLGSRDSQYNQVGEAVPVPLARAIARVVKAFLDSGSF